MKEFLKNILKSVGLYHPLQGWYRHKLFKARSSRIYFDYEEYKGYGLVCNVCGSSYKKFAPDEPNKEDREALAKHNVIAGYGENVFCPNCMSKSRERLIIAIFGHIDLFGKKILYFSPERNVWKVIKNQTAPITVDLFPEFYTRVDSDIKKADATDLKYPDESFDMVIGNHIMEHIPDDRKAMREIYRVLKPGGQAVLQIPFSTTLENTIEEPSINDPKRQSKLFGQRDHVRIYQLNDYLSRLREVGFTVHYIPHEELKEFHKHAIQKGEGFIEIRK